MRGKTKVIIFDMDNTVVRSHIDFSLMRRNIELLLAAEGIECSAANTAASLIQAACGHPKMSDALKDALWDIVGAVEEKGMLNACPEPGIAEVLRDLRCDAELMLLSNNKDNHIESVLQRLGLKCFFKEIAGRGSVAEIKPSPAGYLRLKNLRPDLTAADFLAVGDAVIDIAAATAAGIPFAAYNGGREENWRQCPFKPALYLRKWDAHACAELKKLLFAT